MAAAGGSDLIRVGSDGVYNSGRFALEYQKESTFGELIVDLEDRAVKKIIFRIDLMRATEIEGRALVKDLSHLCPDGLLRLFSSLSKQIAPLSVWQSEVSLEGRVSLVPPVHAYFIQRIFKEAVESNQQRCLRFQEREILKVSWQQRVLTPKEKEEDMAFFKGDVKIGIGAFERAIWFKEHPFHVPANQIYNHMILQKGTDLDLPPPLIPLGKLMLEAWLLNPLFFTMLKNEGDTLEEIVEELEEIKESYKVELDRDPQLPPLELPEYAQGGLCRS